MFEYPKGGDNWYQGKHKPIITKQLFEKAQEQLKRDQIIRENKKFAFTKLFTCGLCSSGVTAEEKDKTLSNGTSAKYVYYGYTRGKDRQCKNKYIREEELIEELLQIIDQLHINEIGMKAKLEEEIKRFDKFQSIIGIKDNNTKINKSIDIKTYAKYLLREGSTTEKRELLSNLRSRLVYTNKKVILLK